MGFAIGLTDEQWGRVADLFDPPGRRGAPARIPRRQMVDALFFLARIGCQWRYLPDRFGPWGAVWQQWRRWRANGVRERAMARLAAQVRARHEREPDPSDRRPDGEGRSYGPTFHNAGGRGGRTIGMKRTILVEILVLPVSARADPAKPHDVRAGRDLLHNSLAGLPRVAAIVARSRLSGPPGSGRPPPRAARHQGSAEGPERLSADRTLYRIEHAFAQLRRWRRLSRCYEGSEASTTAWLQVASIGYLLGRA